MPSKKNEPKAAIWYNLSEAAEILGVHFTTLRRWADAGDIECVRTPGGRRRFKAETVHSFLENASKDDDEATYEIIEKQFIDNTRHELQNSDLNEDHWIVEFNGAQRKLFKKTGNRIAELMLDYARNEGDVDEMLEEGIDIARDYGDTCRQAGLPIARTLEAFLYFKQKFFSVFHEIESWKNLQDFNSYQRVSQFFDEMLIALVEQYTIHAPMTDSYQSH